MSRARVLLLNGSPNAHGQSMRLAEAMLGVFSAAGGEIDVAQLYDLQLFPCRACGCCRASGGECPLADAAADLLGRLRESDIVLVASPLHFSSLTAPVIAFFSRFQVFWQARKMGRHPFGDRTRQAALVLTAGSTYPEMFRPARSVAAAAFNTLGVALVGMATAVDTDNLPVARNAEALTEAEKLARTMLAVVGGGR